MPASDIHFDESIVFHDAQALSIAIEMLGGDASFHDTRHIELLQTMVAAKAFLENKEPIYSSEVDEILLEDRNKWLPKLHVTVNADFSSFSEGIRENRERGHTAMQGIFDRWKNERKTFEEVLNNELYSTMSVKTDVLRRFFSAFQSSVESADPEIILSAIGNPVLTEYQTLRALAEQHGFDDDNADRFVLSYWGSDQARSPPNHRFSAYLFAAIARRAANGMNSKKMTRGILNDVRAISTFAHYVDAMFIDRECANMLSEGPLNSDLSYKAQVFSFADPAAFIDYLKGLDEGTDPIVRRFAAMLYG